jgi:hypothetical protein
LTRLAELCAADAALSADAAAPDPGSLDSTAVALAVADAADAEETAESAEDAATEARVSALEAKMSATLASADVDGSSKTAAKTNASVAVPLQVEELKLVWQLLHQSSPEPLRLVSYVQVLTM